MPKRTKNYYAVKKGRIPGIYKTWDESKEQTNAFSGAVFKGFASRSEAKRFMGSSAGRRASPYVLTKYKKNRAQNQNFGGGTTTYMEGSLNCPLAENDPNSFFGSSSDFFIDLFHDAVHSRHSVLSNKDLLKLILEFEGSLAFYHRHYDLIVGYKRSMLYLPSGSVPGSCLSVDTELRTLPGTASNMFVSKSWMSMVAGKDGWDYLKSRSKEQEDSKRRIALEAKSDLSLSWTARLCAMAIADDADALKEAFKNEKDKSCGIGAAVKEQWYRVVEESEWPDSEKESYEEYNYCFEPVPGKHPFSPYCVTNCFEDMVMDEWIDVRAEAFATSIAYAAALTGSTKALAYLDSYVRQEKDFCEELWKTKFSPEGDDSFIMSLVEYACENPWLDAPIASIRTILPGRNNFKDHGDECDLHAIHYGGNGNNLHLAAARGHKSLVEALLEGGMNPSRKCTDLCNSTEYRLEELRMSLLREHARIKGSSDPIADERIDDAGDKGVQELELYLPDDWARVRGHNDVAELLCSARTKWQSDLRGGGAV